MIRRSRSSALAGVLAALCLAGTVWAVEPSEMLQDPAQEARARDISAGLRCLVCQNESIDESNASLAKDLRVLVRERITAGDSNDEVIDFVVARYGEFVLLKPTTGGLNWLLWAAGPILFVLAMVIGLNYTRNRAKAAAPNEAALSEAEQKRLDEILRGD